MNNLLIQIWNLDSGRIGCIFNPLHRGALSFLWINFESTFCYPRILPKKERNNSIIVLLGQKNEFVRSFFGRIVGLKKTLRLFLTYGSNKSIRKETSKTHLCALYQVKEEFNYRNFWSNYCWILLKVVECWYHIVLSTFVFGKVQASFVLRYFFEELGRFKLIVFSLQIDRTKGWSIWKDFEMAIIVLDLVLNFDFFSETFLPQSA